MSTSVSQAYRISPLQRRLWLLQNRDRQTSYSAHALIELAGILDTDKLTKCQQILVRRHEALRTAIRMVPGISVPVQVVEDDFSQITISRPSAEATNVNIETNRTEEPRFHALAFELLSHSKESHSLRLKVSAAYIDATGLEIVISELCKLYNGTSPEQLAEAMQYPDVSEWLNSQATDDNQDAVYGRQYWLQQTMNVATADANDEQNAFIPDRMPVKSSPEILRQIRKGEEEGRWTIRGLMFACWAILLNRFGHQAGEHYAVVCNGRTLDALRLVAGPLTQSVPVKLNWTLHEPLSQVSARAAAAIKEAEEWQAYFSWESVYSQVSDTSKIPYLPYSFGYRHVNQPDADNQDTRFTTRESEVLADRFDMHLSCIEDGQDLRCHVYWNTNLWQETQAKKLVEGLATILAEVASSPQMFVRDINILDNGQREKLLHNLNATTVIFTDSHLQLHEVFEQQVQRTPDAVAARYEGESLSYRELNESANRVAAVLASMGLGVGELAGICLERSLYLPIAILGVLKAGGAYAPLDPDYPKARIDWMLKDSCATIVLTDKAMAGELNGCGARLADVHSICRSSVGPNSTIGKSHSDNPAYVIYTSGSTGMPKGVVIPHRAICNHMAWMAREFPLLTGDNVLQKTAFSFDASVWEYYAPLFAGGCLVIARPGGQQDSRYLVDCIQREAITVLQLIPTQLKMLLEENGFQDCTSLRRIFCGGEELLSQLVDGCRYRLPSAAIYNLYGPTEATIDSTCAQCEWNMAGIHAPIGRPIANTKSYVLDETFQPVPFGVKGDLYLAGKGLATGYLGRPALTAESFGPNPFSVNGERLYRTGDLASWTEGGTLEFLGRKDGQIKFRGYRIELGEIESVLSSAEGLKEAVVCVRHDPLGQERLVAYVTAVSEIQDNALIDHMKLRLPDYMVPSKVVHIDKLPVLPNGKLDRKALPEPDWDRISSVHADPRDVEEDILCGIFGEVLKHERVGIHDDFFELGGHSLLATQVMARVRSAFEIEIPLRTFLEVPTVAELAERVRQARGSQRAPLPPVQHLECRDGLPLSYGQQRLWIIEQLDPGNPAYNMYFGLKLTGELDKAALRRSMNEIVRRHEILRTIFPVIKDEPLQKIAAAMEISIPEVDISGLTEVERLEEAQELAKKHARQPFNLAEGPLLSLQLLRLQEHEHVLLIAMHHIISDGWSMGILTREFGALYAAFVSGDPSPLPGVELQYGDFAFWQREWLKGDVLENQLAYWRKQLKGVSSLELPTDFPRPQMPSHHGGSELVSVDKDLIYKLKELSRSEGVTLFMVLLASLQTLLSRYAEADDVVVGTVIANRSRVETERVIGFFVNTLALRTDLSGQPSFRELLGRVRRVVFDAYDHQDVPFEKIVEDMAPERNLAKSPIFQVMLALQNLDLPEFNLPGLRLDGFRGTGTAEQFDMTLELKETASGLTGTLLYQKDLFTPARMKRLLEHWKLLLHAMAAHPDSAIKTTSLLTHQEEENLLVWNQTSRVFPKKSVVELFQEQVRRTPDSIAVDDGNVCLSYSELSRGASRLARKLKALGVERDMRVGICLNRNSNLILGMFGVLQAGAAYVPIDPSYPEVRRKFILEDTKAVVLLTETATYSNVREFDGALINLDDMLATAAPEEPETVHDAEVDPQNLAYVIYTSGSTGKPKGVGVTHGGLSNFLMDMREKIAEPEGTWLALTNMTFDIAALEILWTLSHGFRVVIANAEDLLDPSDAETQAARTSKRLKPIDFSLFYFATDNDEPGEKYKLLLEGARFADQHGFSAVWTPERHFHSFGGLYPNPSLMGTAIAAITENVKIRAGSVVLPLHNPVRVAEEWSVVDNLSKGRAGISFASGWQANDFILSPGHYNQRRQIMLRDIAVVRSLWRGQTITLPDGTGSEVPIAIYPKPRQPELPVWLTSAGGPETFRMAGEIGANVLTHLLGQNLNELAEKIAIYRESWKRHGHDGSGYVTLMMHSYVGVDMDAVKRKIRQPFCNYLKHSVDLTRRLVRNLGTPDADKYLQEDDRDAMVEHAFERYFETSGLMGTVESCLAMVERLKEMEVDEVACLIDFGVDFESVMQSLALLKEIKEVSNSRPRQTSKSSARGARPFSGITHLQCTPSLARLFAGTVATHPVLRSLQRMFVGGEALPASLVQQLQGLTDAKISNMYGPTETTIWSAVYNIEQKPGHSIPIGEPIANTKTYVLDKEMQLLASGFSGELFIGGQGLARGYLNQADLTAERFVPNPFGTAGGERLYRTGDYVKWLPEGKLDFQQRIDQQVKIRGHRIELGEIEAAITEFQGIMHSVVVARELNSGEKSLVGYVVPAAETGDFDVQALRSHLQNCLPGYMVPGIIIPLHELPLTPSGKVDFKALPQPDLAQNNAGQYMAPRGEAEQILTTIWADLLKLPAVGIQDNFFEIGGDSILAIQVVNRAREAGLKLTPRNIFEQQTVARLAEVAARTNSANSEDEQGVITGQALLSPVQSAFFDLTLAQPDHFNQAVLLKLGSAVDSDLLEATVTALLSQHDALRTKFVHAGTGLQQLWSADIPKGFYERKDLTHHTGKECPAQMEQDINQVHRTLDLQAGAIFKCVEYDMGPEHGRRLLLVAHHLVFDGVSWRILLEDLEKGYQKLKQGDQLGFGRKTASFKSWINAIHTSSDQGRFLPAAEYWKNLDLNGVAPLPQDHSAAAGNNSISSQRHIVVSLAEDETRDLLQKVPAVYHTQVNDTLLTALAKVCCEWSGGNTMLVDLEGHGREEILADLDVSRTVGWFTTIYPVALHLTAGEISDPGVALRTVKEQLRKVPNRGCEYGVLRYLSNDDTTRQYLQHMPQAEISFNYLGQFDQTLERSDVFAFAPEDSGQARGPENRRQYLLDLNLMVIRGKLQANWSYSEEVHSRETMDKIARRYMECLRELIAHCNKQTESVYTPSDFPQASLTQEELSYVGEVLND